jgi:asparagine synthase (glutamine-hydrolysing)
MCGICGIAGNADREVIERMTANLVHRGPDDGGVETFPRHNLALGHRRLSIIDVSPRGRQPMSNSRCAGGEDGSLWISFNGEIYNYRELKDSLDTSCHRFKSETDTEVILHLYEERGTAAFQALNGMFAFALYDAGRERLFLARDHFGVKPLYYAEANGRFLFGSEIKAILASGCYSPEIDWQSASDFFSFLYVPAPQTIFRGIHQLPPAHWLEYDLRARRIVRIERYWDVAEWGADGIGCFPERRDIRCELRALVADAVEKQMVSDVPLGAFLSGGIDSNVIVGLMAERASKPVKTFTVLFEGSGVEYYDERREARRVAERFSTEHHELPIDLSHPEEMLDLVECFDQPFGNTTFYLTWLLSRYTRQSVTVALSGAGGDELFGGYPRYRAVRAMRWLRLAPRMLAKAALAATARFQDDFADRRLHRIRALLAGLDRDPARQYLQWVYYLDEARKARLLKANHSLPAHRVLQSHLGRIPAHWDDGNRFSFLDTETFLPDNLLEYSDKTSMAWSLELRVPFLDPRVAELAFHIPFELKLNRAGSKMVMREAFADLIPEENLRAPKKGFNVPLGVWMRTKFDRYFDELLPRDYVGREGIFNYEYIALLRDEHRRGRRDNAYELFAILIFDTWYRKYIR